jgi:hypothetical protein
MRMPGERVARQVLFGQLRDRGRRSVGSPPVTLRDLMRKDVLLLNGGGGQVHGRRWYQQCMEKAAWRTSVDSVLQGIQVLAWSRNSLERQPRSTLGPCCNTDRQTNKWMEKMDKRGEVAEASSWLAPTDTLSAPARLGGEGLGDQGGNHVSSSSDGG